MIDEIETVMSLVLSAIQYTPPEVESSSGGHYKNPALTCLENALVVLRGIQTTFLEGERKPCGHEFVTRLPGITNGGVKISVCRNCGEQLEDHPE